MRNLQRGRSDPGIHLICDLFEGEAGNGQTLQERGYWELHDFQENSQARMINERTVCLIHWECFSLNVIEWFAAVFGPSSLLLLFEGSESLGVDVPFQSIDDCLC